jgi:hypothetical protein
VVLKEHGNHEGGKSAINHQHLEYVASSPTQPSSRVRCDVVLTTGMYVVVPVVFNADTHNAIATPRHGSHGSHGTVMVDSIVLCFYATQPLLITELRTLPCVVEQALVGRITHHVRRTTNAGMFIRCVSTDYRDMPHVGQLSTLSLSTCLHVSMYFAFVFAAFSMH